MPAIEDLTGLVLSQAAGLSRVEVAIFGEGGASSVATSIVGHVESTVGKVETSLGYRLGVGVVAALRLADGRDVVIKIHRWRVTVDRLRAVQRVQQHLAVIGLPAPCPLAPPMRLGAGIATIEEYRPAESANGHDPQVREAIAVGLHQFIMTAQSLEDVGGLEDRSHPGGRSDHDLWGEPHDLRFDFGATTAGAEWIDELAREARACIDVDLDRVIAHFDWRVENLGFDGSTITAIYDWDSVARAPEAVAVGYCAGGFSTDWRVGPQTLPSIEEMRAFLAAYENARGSGFTRVERDVLDAANLYVCAYGARCEHSDRQLNGRGRDYEGVGWIHLLQARSEKALFA